MVERPTGPEAQRANEIIRSAGIESTNEEARTQLARVPLPGIGIDILTFSRATIASGLCPGVKTQAQAVVKIAKGLELGVGPMAALEGIHSLTFDGVTTLMVGGNLRASIIKRSGRYTFRVIEHTDAVCEYEFFEIWKGERESVGTVRFTIEEAKKAGLIDRKGSLWGKYPKDMLFNAVMRRGSKRFCPDLFIGDPPDRNNELEIAERVTSAELEDRSSGVVQSEYWSPTPELEDAEVVDESSGTDDAKTADAAGRIEGVRDLEPAETRVEEAGAPPDDEPVADAAVGPEDGGSAPSSGSLFDGEGADLAGVANESPPGRYTLVIGALEVPYAAGYVPRTSEPQATDEQVGVVRRILGRLDLTGGALEPIFEARYGFPLSEGTAPQVVLLGQWLHERAKPARTRKAG